MKSRAIRGPVLVGNARVHKGENRMARIAMPLASDFEDSEFTVPFDRLKHDGNDVVVIGRKAGEIVIGKRGQARATIDHAAAGLKPDDFDAVVIPGGYSPDHLRMDEDVVAFVRDFFATGKPVAAICHGPQLLIEAEVVKGHTLTSWPSIRKDLINAGAKWVDREVVVDGTLITSRKPADLDAFCNEVLACLRGAEQRHSRAVG
jgi:protease I